jgi:predicted permease
MPDWRKLIRQHLAKLRLAPAREAEIVEELAQHAEDRYRELETGGTSPAEAVRLALEELNVGELMAQSLEDVEPCEAPEPLLSGTGIWRDVRYGIRSLRTNRALTLVMIAVLGLAIGADVAMFTVIDAAFLRPLRLPQPERLVQIQETPPGGGFMTVAYPNFLDWKKQAHSFEAMGIGGVYEETLQRPGANERVQVGYVSPGFLRAYGIKPIVGRLLGANDDRPGAVPAALLSERFWRARYAGEGNVIGRSLAIDGTVWTIAGVAPAFEWNRRADLFVPISFGLDKWGLNMRENHSGTGVVARLKPGVTVGQARNEMKLIAAQLAAQYPGANGGNSAVVLPLRDYLGGGMRQEALMMFGAVGLLLLIACANVAGLLLARAAVRQREIGIRIALGAGRLQLIRQLLTESLLLALASAGAGIAVAWFSIAGLERIFPDVRDLGGLAIDGRVLGFSILAAVLTAVLFGLAPALQLTRLDVSDAMKSGGRSSGGGTLRMRTRRLLVVGQVALAVVLSVGAGLLMRSLIAALQTDPGFRAEHVVTAPLVPANSVNSDLADTARFLRMVSDRLSTVPGVVAAGVVSDIPFGDSESWGDFYRDDRPMPAPGHLPNAMHAEASAGYFSAMGIPLLAGRLFDAADGRMPSVKHDIPSLIAYIRSVELVSVINQSMARKFWPGEDPIGKSFRFGPPSLKGPRVKIIGVVGDARQLGLDRPVEPQYFFSAEQFPVIQSTLVVRTAGDLSQLASVIRRIVSQEQPDAVVSKVEAMDTVVGRSLNGRQNNVALLGLFSGIALLLAALGLYATMAYMVAQRNREIGLRMALGAAASDVRLMVLREAALLAGAGVILGLAAAAFGARVVASMLYGITSTDALTYAASAVLLAMIMLVASYFPAWRASRVDPMKALRCE